MHSYVQGVNVGNRSRMHWPTALLAGVGGGLLYTVVVVGYSLLPGPAVSVNGSAWRLFGVAGLLSLGSIGVPVVLWVRYRLRSPVACLAIVLLSCHVLVQLLPDRAGMGDMPGFFLVLGLAPVYVGAYGLLAAAEHWIRGRHDTRVDRRMDEPDRL